MRLPQPPRTIPVFDRDGALSRAYLIDRGYCCENGCRNCPYGSRDRVAHDAPDSRTTHEPERAPQRIVSLCPSNTEIACALGLAPRLVGVDDWSDWPEAIKLLPRVGPDLGVDLGRVAALQPDLVLASLSVPGMEHNVQGLCEQGLLHLVLDPHSVADLWENIRAVGRAAMVERQAAALVAELQARVERVREATAQTGARPKLYWEWWPKPIFAPGARNWLTEISDIAGGVSVTAGVDADSARPTPDEVLATDPDWILLAWTGVAKEKVRPDVLLRRPGWRELRAVREGRVRVLDEGLFCRPSPRLIDGLEQLARLIHPDQGAA
ncbi:MAG: helical backbone metal receptor [Actinomycetota bacterium]